MAMQKSDLAGALPLIASGKVRDLYKVDDSTLLFVATDRISAFDVVMENVSFSGYVDQTTDSISSRFRERARS